MEELLRARLMASVVGVPSDWGLSAQGSTLPRIVLHRVSGGVDYTMDGPSGYSRPRVQVDCYAATVGAAKLLARQVKAALSGWKSGAILGVFLTTERDLTPDTEGATTVGRVSLDFFVHHQEA
jgi:hypothetical protein